jgi:hypothetical protein
MKTYFLVVAMLFAISLQAETITLGNEVFSTDVIITADVIVLKRNCTIKVENGKSLTLKCRILRVEENFVIDAQGKNGIDQGPVGDWKTSPSDDWHALFGGHDAHAQWETAKYDGVTGGARGYDGTNGEDGGTVYIYYEVFEGIQGGLGSLVCKTKGGRGGKGGAGVILHCADHPSEYFQKPSGNNGKAGIDGKYVIKQTPFVPFEEAPFREMP